MPINSKRKGSRVQLNGCKHLEQEVPGLLAQRTQQYCGNSGDSSDIRTNYSALRFQIKGGYNQLGLHSKEVQDWYTKACEETRNAGQVHRINLILWKRDRKPWLLIYENHSGGLSCTAEVGKYIQFLIEVRNIERDTTFELTQQRGRKAGNPKDSG